MRTDGQIDGKEKASSKLFLIFPKRPKNDQVRKQRCKFRIPPFAGAACNEVAKLKLTCPSYYLCHEQSELWFFTILDVFNITFSMQVYWKKVLRAQVFYEFKLPRHTLPKEQDTAHL